MSFEELSILYMYSCLNPSLEIHLNSTKTAKYYHEYFYSHDLNICKFSWNEFGAARFLLLDVNESPSISVTKHINKLARIISDAKNSEVFRKPITIRRFCHSEDLQP